MIHIGKKIYLMVQFVDMEWGSIRNVLYGVCRADKLNMSRVDDIYGLIEKLIEKIDMINPLSD